MQLLILAFLTAAYAKSKDHTAFTLYIDYKLSIDYNGNQLCHNNSYKKIYI